MIDIRLEDLELFKILGSRDEPAARIFQGALVVVAGDARELLQFARKRFPSFTSHDLQHSWRIVNRIESILTRDAKLDLSSVEIFAFILAAALHDVGMISSEGTAEEVRKTHHVLSESFVLSYMADRLSLISEYVPRLAESIGFIVKSHGTAWDEMIAGDLFKRPERIAGQILRTNILSILLRIGDLLDLDSDRSCDALMRHGASYFEDDVSKIHHQRHKHVRHFNYDSSEIAVIAEAHSKEEHSIWDEWFSYIRQDILHANTYIFKDTLGKYHLPVPLLEVKKASGARYDLWPIRFELDEKGRIWEIISKSIYVGRLDFIRELIQNAIDATLVWIYLDSNALIESDIPRLWSMEGYRPVLLVLFDGKSLEVIDDGVGMNKEALKRFLFRVAETGFGESPRVRTKRFPSIAKFGIGFVSCLVRASKIVINTKARTTHDKPHSLGSHVILKPQALDAYTEDVECREGTRIWLELKDNIKGHEIVEYLRCTFVFPSATIMYIDSQQVQEMIHHATELKVKHEFKFPLEINDKSLWSTLRVIEQIQELRQAIFKAVPSNERSAFLFDNVVGVISPQEVFAKLPRQSFFIFLDAELKRAGVARKPLNGIRSAGALVWIPVRILLPERGIDWASLHGFIIHKDVLSHSIVAFTEVAKEFDNPSFHVTMSEDEWIENEFDDTEHGVVDLVDIMSRRRSRLGKQKIEAGVDSGLNRISIMSDRIIISYDGESEEDFPINVHRGNRNEVGADMEQEIQLNELIRQLDNKVYQDGIPVPVAGYWIAPIGACRSKCNLTGSARLELNVSRNAINESPTLLSLWAQEVAQPIQKAVVRRIVGVLRRAGYEFDPKLLFTPVHQKTALTVQTSIVLNSLLDDEV